VRPAAAVPAVGQRRACAERGGGRSRAVHAATALRAPTSPSPSVTLNISNVMPLPVNLSIDAAPLDANLYRPLVKVWGGKVAELDGTPTETRNYDEVASRTQYNWIAR
jgi:hypothetical protein